MQKRVLLITGNPGVGKTTLLWNAINALSKESYSVGGMISREVRQGKTRVGFEIMDLSTFRSGWLAHINHKKGPQIGKYRVNLEDLQNIGVAAISDAIISRNVIAIDEIGPMELTSQKFRETVKEALSSNKLLLAVVHWKIKEPIIREIRNRQDAITFTVTVSNREESLKSVLKEAIKFLKQHNHFF